MKCTGLNCPMQHGYDVENCNLTDCKYITKPMTNYDRIRNMTIEEMAKLLIRYDEEWGDFATDSGKNYLKYDEALKAEIKWLEAEVQGDES